MSTDPFSVLQAGKGEGPIGDIADDEDNLFGDDPCPPSFFIPHRLFSDHVHICPICSIYRICIHALLGFVHIQYYFSVLAFSFLIWIESQLCEKLVVFWRYFHFWRHSNLP